MVGLTWHSQSCKNVSKNLGVFCKNVSSKEWIFLSWLHLRKLCQGRLQKPSTDLQFWRPGFGPPFFWGCSFFFLVVRLRIYQQVMFNAPEHKSLILTFINKNLRYFQSHMNPMDGRRRVKFPKFPLKGPDPSALWSFGFPSQTCRDGEVCRVITP